MGSPCKQCGASFLKARTPYIQGSQQEIGVLRKRICRADQREFDPRFVCSNGAPVGCLDTYPSRNPTKSFFFFWHPYCEMSYTFFHQKKTRSGNKKQQAYTWNQFLLQSFFCLANLWFLRCRPKSGVRQIFGNNHNYRCGLKVPVLVLAVVASRLE